MVAEIISVGTELLMGQILNSNAQYLSGQFAAMGIDHFFEVTVGDNMERLIGTIEQAADRSDIVILTGGLGPTEDDLTKYALAKYLKRDMFFDEQTKHDIDGFFTMLGRKTTANNYRQCEFPIGSVILKNNNGTAPGCLVEEGGKCFVVLPGPPHEMKAMFEEAVKPFLSEKSEFRIYSKMLRIIGVGESALEDCLKDLIDTQNNPTLATYATLGECMLRVTAKCRIGEDAEKLLAPTICEVKKRLGSAIYSFDDKPLNIVVSELLKNKELTLAVAESITGGLIASELISQPGASAFFNEGTIAYSNEAKIRLGVHAGTIEQFGAVSKETCAAMARAIRARSSASIGLATTGNAGPGAMEGKPGEVYIGICADGFENVISIVAGGSRQRNRVIAMLNALNMIRLYICQKSEQSFD